MSEQVSDSPVIFAYDGMSRRTKITELSNGTVTSKKLYFWLGGTIVCERDGLVSGFPITKRYFGQGVLQGATKLFYTFDHLGSVRELVDDAGTVQAQYRYSTYGERTKESGNLDSDWGYAGLWHHGPSGLDLATYRLYDAANKRWISRDPLGEGVDYSLYRYCGNNPVGWSDPNGLEPSMGAVLGWYGRQLASPMGFGMQVLADQLPHDPQVERALDNVAGTISMGAGLGGAAGGRGLVLAGVGRAGAGTGVVADATTALLGIGKVLMPKWHGDPDDDTPAGGERSSDYTRPKGRCPRPPKLPRGTHDNEARFLRSRSIPEREASKLFHQMKGSQEGNLDYMFNNETGDIFHRITGAYLGTIR